MDAWLTSLSGDWGPWLLGLYLDHSIWINAIVVVYGAVLLLSWQNARRLRDHLRAEVAQQLEGRRGEPELDSADVPWGEALSASRFPLIAAEWGLLPHRVSVEALQAVVPLKDLLPEARASKRKAT